MLRKVMGAFVALVLVATLLLPLASVGAQEEEIELGPAPIATEESAPESQPPPAVEEPPIVEPQPEVPVEDEPVVEQPAAEQPVVEEPVGEETVADAPLAEDPPADQPATETTDPQTEESAPTVEQAPTDLAESDNVETSDEGDGAPEEGEWNPSSITGLTVDCTGLVSFSFVSWQGEELTVSIGTTDSSANPGWGGELNSITFLNTSGSDFSYQISFEGDPADLFATVYSIESYEPIGVSPTVICHEITEPEPEPEPEDPEETGPASIVSHVSVTCDGSVTFTISEAQVETLWIDITDPGAPYPHNQLAAGSFDVTETGTFTLEFQLADPRDAVRASISNDANSWSAQINDCLTEEWETSGMVSGMTVSCDGAVSFTVTEDLALPGGLHLYGSHGGSWQSIASTPLGVLVSGERAHQFEVPADTWERLRAEVSIHNGWLPAGIAEVGECLEDQTPDPEPVDASITNLRLFCNGLVRFDLTAANPVTLDIDLSTIAPTPEFARSAQLSGGAGSYQHQFGVPAAWYNDFNVVISLGGTALAETSIFGCLTTNPNDVTGDEILVFTRYGSVVFDHVTAGGETNIGPYSEPNPPALPSGFDGSDARYFDLSSTATHSGAIEVCLNLSQPFIDDSEGVRLLQYVGGSWVDVTSSVQADLGQACGMTTSLSPFAIARQIDDSEPETGNTPTGSDVEVEVGRGGTILFDAVDTAGETTVTILDPSQAPPLPVQYQGTPVILLDISTTASFTGPATFCLPVVASFGSLDGVRMLHYENGAWVDITLSIDPATRVVCGVSSSFSPFAIVRLADDEPGEPVQPGPKPHTPGNQGSSGGSSNVTTPRSLSTVGASSAGTSQQIASFPNTGSGAPTAEHGPSTTLPVLLSLLALAAALALQLPRRSHKDRRP